MLRIEGMMGAYWSVARVRVGAAVALRESVHGGAWGRGGRPLPLRVRMRKPFEGSSIAEVRRPLLRRFQNLSRSWRKFLKSPFLKKNQ